MANQALIAHGFDRLAYVYDFFVWLVFGNRLFQFQKDALRLVQKSHVCAIVGGGTGKLLRAAVDQEVAERFYYIEISKKMREAAKSKLTSLQQYKVDFDSTDLRINVGIDTVVFPFVLDCLSEENAKRMIVDYTEKMSKDGTVLIIDFSLENQPKKIQKAFISILYAAFRILTSIEANSLPRLQSIAKEIGLKQIAKRELYGGWIYAAAYKLPRPISPSA